MRALIAYIRAEWRQLNRCERISGAITVTVLFILFTGQLVHTAPLGGTNVAAPVVPFTDQDTYATHDARYGRGGLTQWQTTSQRNLIPVQRRYTGMFAWITDTEKLYYLKGGTSNAHWSEFSPGGGVTSHPNLSNRDAADSHPQSAITDLVADLAAILAEFRNYTSAKSGLPGWRRPYDGRNAPPPLSMIIEGNAQTITYDATGRNPQPAALTFIGYVLEGLTTLTENITWNWYSPSVPGTTHILPPPAEMDGMQNHCQSYTVTAMERYSSHRIAWVRLQGIYSSPKWPWGKREITMRIPISVVRSGS